MIVASGGAGRDRPLNVGIDAIPGSQWLIASGTKLTGQGERCVVPGQMLYGLMGLIMIWEVKIVSFAVFCSERKGR